MIENIVCGDRILAIILRATYHAEGINFFTPDNFSQQLAYMSRPAGYVIAPHIHNVVARQIMLTQEVIYIKSGSVRVDFYDDDKKYLESRLMNKGDIVLLASGGHGFEMLEDSEIIEVKQGPYAGEADKNRFTPIGHEKIFINGSARG